MLLIGWNLKITILFGHGEAPREKEGENGTSFLVPISVVQSKLRSGKYAETGEMFPHVF